MSSEEPSGAPHQGSESGRSEAFAALAGGLVHELNNLLSATVMLVDLLSASCKVERDRELLGSVDESARRGVALVRQLSWLASGSEEKGTLFQPRYLLLDVARMIQATSSPAISVASDFPQDLLLLQGDPFQVYVAFLELCHTARGQLSSGGTLSLSARNELLDEIGAAQRPGLAAGPHLVLEVTASCGGGEFSASAAAVFAACGAVAEVAAAAGGGQVFRLYLPAAGIPAEEEKKLNRAPEPGGGELVLVVEGDAAVRQALAGVLEQHSYRTLAAADGAEAVALFAQSSATIALVLVGTGLRFLDGPAVVRAVRRLREDVLVVATGGADELAAWPQDPTLVTEAVLPKPFTVPDLLAAVHRVLTKVGVVRRTTRESSRR
jgi:two-component system cell cycle sensor histidine kinase/response regulator CckA